MGKNGVRKLMVAVTGVVVMTAGVHAAVTMTVVHPYESGLDLKPLTKHVLIQSWRGTAWADSQRLTYTLNADGTAKEILRERLWSGKWENWEQRRFAYANGVVTNDTLKGITAAGAWETSGYSATIMSNTGNATNITQSIKDLYSNAPNTTPRIRTKKSFRWGTGVLAADTVWKDTSAAKTGKWLLSENTQYVAAATSLTATTMYYINSNPWGMPSYKWVNNSKTVLTFDANGNLLTSVRQDWKVSGTSGTWVYGDRDSRDSLVYVGGVLKEKVVSSFISSKWVPHYKEIYLNSLTGAAPLGVRSVADADFGLRFVSDRNAMHFTISSAAGEPVSLEVLDLLGNRVASIADRQQLGAGSHILAWHPQRSCSGPMSYVVRCLVGDRTLVRQFVVNH